MFQEDHLVFSTVRVDPGQWLDSGNGWLFLLVQEGQGVCVGRMGEQIAVKPGDALIVTSTPLGRVRASGVRALGAACFRFHPEQLTGLLNLTERRILDRIGGHGSGFRVFPAGSQFARQFDAILRHSTSSPSNGLAQRCQVLQLVAVLLSEERQTLEVAAPGPVSSEDRVKAILSQISETELQQLSVAELARRCACSRRHLTRLFRKNFGQSVIHMKMDVRLEKAASLLRASDAKIIDVAMECGFTHLGLFSAKFRQRYGARPSEWRRSDAASVPDRVVSMVTGERALAGVA